MPLTVTWADLAARLLSTLIAGAILGYNRGEQGKSAGLRTTLLVCLAASVAMLQVNELLDLSGRPADSFVMNDLMRLPLGILTGVGFIGAGAILRRRDIVIGVTTAATLWYVTVIGLCFGGGQLVLGWIATAIGCLVLWGLRWVENFLPEQMYARLIVAADSKDVSESLIRDRLSVHGIEIINTNVHIAQRSRRYVLNVRKPQRSLDQAPPAIPPVVEELERQSGVVAVDWQTIT
jgi:putative Mg2+ transporter-C (MgtC) family protein